MMKYPPYFSRLFEYFGGEFSLSGLTILKGKNCFTQFSTRIDAWLLLTFFICLQNQLSSIHSILLINKECRCLKNVLHQIDSKNECLLLSGSFTAKFAYVFVLRFKNAFSQGFHFKANRKSICSSKKLYQEFSKQPSV